VTSRIAIADLPNAIAIRFVRARRPQRLDRVRLEPDEDRVLRAVAGPPRAPAERTVIAPPPDARWLDERDVDVFRAAARPPRAPAARTVIVPRPDARRVDEREAVDLREPPDLRDVVLREPVVFRAVVLRELVDLRDVVDFRFAPLDRDVVDFRPLVDLLRVPVVFRAVVLRELVDLRDVVDFRFAPLDRDVVDFRPLVDLPRELVAFRELELEPPRDDDFRELDDFVWPAFARCLLTVRAAISSARSSERPCSFSDCLMCLYWRSRLLLQAF
jgi:hypothetical protein